MGEVQPRQIFAVAARLWPNQLQFIAMRLHQFAASLGAHANPVNRRQHRQSAIGFHRNGKAARVQRIAQRLIDLQHRFPARQHDIAVSDIITPTLGDLFGQSFGIGIFAAQRAISSDEIRVAKLTNRLGAILLAARP